MMFLTVVLAGLSLQAMTPEQVAQQQAEIQQQIAAGMAKARIMTFNNTTYVGYNLKFNLKGKNNCSSQTIYIYPASLTQPTVTKSFGYDPSCCMTSFELVYVPTNCTNATSCKQQTWYSKSNLNNGNGICKNTTFTIVTDNSAEYGIRVDW